MKIVVNCSSNCGTATLFLDGNYLECTGIQDGGTQSMPMPSWNFPLGPHTLSLFYNGGADSPAASSAPFPFQVASPPAAVIPVGVTLSSNTMNYGQPGAIVTADNGYSDNVGFGNIFLDGQNYAGFTYTRGASFQLSSSIPPGTHTIRVDFLGTANYAFSSGSAAFTVVAPIPVISTAPVIHQGGAAQFILAVACPSNCGTATVFLNGSPLEGTGIPDGGLQTMTLPSWNLQPGTYTLTSVYDGSPSFPAGTTASTTFQIVTPAAAAVPVTMSVSPDPSVSSQAGPMETADNGYSDGPEYGNIFLDGGLIAGFTYVRGESFQIPSGLPPGTHTIRVDFSGTPNYAFSSQTRSFTVQ